MSVHCATDVNHKVAAFTMYLNTNQNQETAQNLTNENVELLSKFAEFLKAEKLEKHASKHEFKHGFKHGKFGKHGHHGMFGHHFAKHGPFGKHGHGHGFGHGHGHGHGFGHGHGHGRHGGERHDFAKHGFEYKNLGAEFYEQHALNFGKYGPEFFGKHGKHHKMGKHYWKWAMFHEACKNNANGECVIQSGRNPSTLPQETGTEPTAVNGASQANNTNCNCACNFKGHHWGRQARWLMCPYRREIPATTSTSTENAAQAETNAAPQENLATLVENISIANTPSPSPQKE